VPQKSLPILVSELWELVRAYARQQTVEPLKGLVRFIGLGLAGALCVGIGSVLLALGGLRALQTETGGRLDNHLSWLPYLVVVVACGAVIGLLVSRIAKSGSKP
jgi:carbon starvation protein CstA